MIAGKPDPLLRAALAACRPLDELDESVVDRIFTRMEERRYEPDEHLIRQGDPGDCLLVIVEGWARIVVRGLSGSSDEIGRFRPGEIVGEMALVTREPRSADIVAGEPVLALALPADDFHELAAVNLELGMVLTRLIGERLGQTARDGLGDKVVNGYRILRRIGLGGMSVVYEAERVEGGERRALKMMSHRLVYETGALARFRQEAKLVSRFRHENIARIYEHFPAYNTEFLVMELCEGPTLTDLVRKGGAMREPIVRGIVGQLAQALEYVHAEGVVHRDVKPSNVMLDTDGRAKLMDFGVARANYEASDRTWTAPSTVIGTPAYMPPEQLSGTLVDRRADTYGLACLALELLGGQAPFRGTDLVALIREKLEFELPPASTIGVGVSDEFHDFLRRGLQFDAEKRPASLADLTAWASPVKP